MSKLKMDAVEVASIIHKGDFSKLSGKSFEMCDNKNMAGKYTLNQLGTKVDQLSMTVDKIGTRVDQLSMTVDKLAKIVNDGFKQVNSRIDQIEARLDYNDLKKLPENK